MIPYGKQSISEQDIAAVVEVLRSSHLTQGPKVTEFEQALSHYCQSKHAIAVNSGTSALHIACLALGVSTGDIVWTSALSFVASANCALYCGATIDFVDVELNTGNMDMQLLANKLADAKKQNQLPNVIIPVHFAGLPCDMAHLAELANIYNFKIIEDACHALGATYQNKPVGSTQFSDICVFSFHPVKNITSGEGGAALTNCDMLARKMRLYSSHGITKDESEFNNEMQGDWYHEQLVLGYNYRMSDIHAALGLNQLTRLTLFIQQRQEIVQRYLHALGEHCDILSQQEPGRQSAHHLFVICVDKAKRKKLFNVLRRAGIWVQLHYMNIASQPYFVNLNFNAADYDNVETISNSAISLPIYSELSIEQQYFVISAVIDELAQS
ncbi:MAG: UDP-4-amino-4,6-dideoxy-N-acetyl-beta-L-altrosamine transaminase [Psychrobium sp.]|nr:UDP-4-amino-4,6-dideoxy-N-acetyl-beta-L-altrosamine transaminase [Psychrobium sp.]